MNEKEKKQEEQPYATELLGMVKSQNKRQFALIVILIALLATTNLYHIYQWSQYETIVVDTTSSGSAGYVEGENYGGVSIGESTSEKKEKE